MANHLRQGTERLQHMWNTWMQDWLDTEATDTQKQRRRAAQTSVFSAWVHRNMGGKHFVMAIWQTGITWAPPVELLNNNINGALEHVAKHFASWTRRLARAVTRHKKDPATEEARVRSGSAPGKHGLTPEQQADRAARRKARSDYYQTVDLLNQLKASKGKGKGKGERSLGTRCPGTRDGGSRNFGVGVCEGCSTKRKQSAIVYRQETSAPSM